MLDTSSEAFASEAFAGEAFASEASKEKPASTGEKESDEYILIIYSIYSRIRRIFRILGFRIINFEFQGDFFRLPSLFTLGRLTTLRVASLREELPELLRRVGRGYWPWALRDLALPPGSSSSPHLPLLPLTRSLAQVPSAPAAAWYRRAAKERHLG